MKCISKDCGRDAVAIVSWPGPELNAFCWEHRTIAIAQANAARVSLDVDRFLSDPDVKPAPPIDPTAGGFGGGALAADFAIGLELERVADALERLADVAEAKYVGGLTTGNVEDAHDLWRVVRDRVLARVRGAR